MANEPQCLFITLYTDADVHGGLTAQIRLRDFDAISAYEAGNAELNDADQLACAVSQRRAILTCNAKDFAPLSKTWWQDGRQHCGIIVAEQLPLGEMLRRVLRMLDAVSADALENGFRNLTEFAGRLP